MALWSAPVVAAESAETCLGCHSDSFATPEKKTVLSVDQSPHAALDCVGCHMDVDPEALPHEKKPGPVDCSMCHSEAAEAYGRSIHKKKSGKDALAADCADCHGNHEIRRVADPASKVYPLNLPGTCGRCHNATRMQVRPDSEVKDAYETYAASVHGKGLLKSGLLVSASCKDCHGSHDIQPNSSADSPMSRKKTPETCGSCHAGVLDEFKKGIHGRLWAAGNAEVPVCTTCHASHEIQKGDAASFQLQAVGGCGRCHAKQIETYRETYHGQVTALGFVAVAKCADCHNNHEVLPKSDPGSPTNPRNLAQTCGKCHEGVNENFIQFQAHGDVHDRENYPLLYWTYLFMSTLLTGTFTFFGIHTLLWFLRSLRERKAHGTVPHGAGEQEGH